MVVCSSDAELHEYIDKDQLTEELGGTAPYCHEEWIEQRVVSGKKKLRECEVRSGLDWASLSIVKVLAFSGSVLITKQSLSVVCYAGS